MSLLLNLIKDLRFQIFCVLMLVVVAIWFLSPYLAINDYYPFSSLEMRLAVILGLVVLWGVSNILLQPETEDKEESAESNEKKSEIAVVNKAIEHRDSSIEHTQAKLQILQQSIKDTLHFLKLNYPKIFLKRKQLPWYLVIGPANAGKTTLLTQSGIPFINSSSTKNTEPKNIHPTPYCDWWFNQNSVFIDTSGSLMIQQTPDYNPNPIWQGFIKSLKPYCRKLMNGIIVVIDINSLSERQLSSLQTDSLCHHLQTLTDYVSEFPVYVVFTKADQLAGFTEFFANISTEERQQVCGISLTPSRNPQNFAQLLNKNYDEFLQRINNQLIWRLHQEQNAKKRVRIKDFPLQLESFKTPIINLVNKIHSTKTHVSGIFFTSSLQEGKTIDYLMKPITQALNLPPLPTTVQRAQAKPYFVQNLLHETIFNPNYYFTRRRHEQSRLPLYIASGVILIAGGLFLWQSYDQNHVTLRALQDEIANFTSPLTNTNSDNAYLNRLDELLSILNKKHHYGSDDNFTLGFSQGRQLQTTISSTYQQTLTQQFVPQLQKTLETQLQSGQIQDLQQLYNTLKVYLMLGNPAKMDKAFVSNWFANYWRENFPNQVDQQAKLMSYLNMLLENKSLTIDLNQNLVALVQQTLTASGLPQLAYFTLEDQYNSKYNIFDTNISRYLTSGSRISSLYTAQEFDTVYNQVIPQISQELSKGNWVLGDQFNTNLSPAQNAELVNNVRTLYVQNYVAAWQQQLADIQFGNINNISDLSSFLKSFSSANSALVQILKVAQTNLQPISTNPDLKKLVNMQLQTINSLNLYANDFVTQKAISNLSNYINNIDNADDIGKTAFNAAQQRMQTGGNNDAIGMLRTQAQQVPAPLSQWLNTIASTSWKVVLANAQTYLNQIWTTQVLPQYNQNIDNRFPISSSSDADISLSNFTVFFGPNGTMNQFFNNYLQAFVNTSQLYWVWKKVDDQQINIPQSALEMFIRAALIQKMFFPNNTTTMQTQFSLTPAAIEPATKNFILSIDNQKVDYLQGLRQTNIIKWPGPNPDSASIQFISTDDQQYNLNESGSWALFKLLNKGDLQATANSKIYNLTFTLNSHTVKFELIATNIINPFIPEILTSFRCPDKL